MKSLKEMKFLSFEANARQPITYFVMMICLILISTSCSKDEYLPEMPFIPIDIPVEVDIPVEIDVPVDVPAAPSGMSIAETAIENGFNELVSALTMVDDSLGTELVELFLNGNNQLTVFAPTDSAFFNLYGAIDGVDAITDLPPSLVLDVLMYHVTEGRRISNSLVPRRGERTVVTLLPGGSFTIDSDASIDAVGSDANIIAPDISATNGIIHVIDDVLIPG